MQFCTSALSVTKLPGGPFPAVKLIKGLCGHFYINTR